MPTELVTSKLKPGSVALRLFMAGFGLVLTASCNTSGTPPSNSSSSSSGAPAPVAVVISNVAAANITSTGATISWTTNQAASSQVEYGTSTTYGSTSSLDPTMVTSHSQAITGLSPGTLYHYRVHSKGADNKDVSSLDNTFTTQATGPGNSGGLQADQLELVINDADPYSVAVGAYYQSKRNVPTSNVLNVNLPTARVLNGPGETADQFTGLKAQVDALPPRIQVVALAWMNPSAVLFKANGTDRMNSLTSALARGVIAGVAFPPPPASPVCWAPNGTTFDSSGNPIPGPPQPYYDSASTQPFTDLGVRPTMLLAAYSIADAQAMIDRGVGSDSTFPHGHAHVLNTSDPLRGIRGANFPQGNLGFALSPYINVVVDNADSISNTTDTLFYFAGTSTVANITTNTFPSGAVGDHLTSTGGVLPDGAGQMSILQWIADGETGSHGAVEEPCATAIKFPDPSIMIKHYASGETLIEAYWKSVYEPFDSAFIGEPLAHPWK